MSKEDFSPVADWYSGRSIFITGASGFMGKVLVEKLLFSCPKVKYIYILLREKRNKSPEERLQQMWTLPVFERLRTEHPNSFKKILILTGDVNTELLGLSEDDLLTLHQQVNVVFHCAATLKLEANLRDSVEQNLTGTKRVLEVCKNIQKLDAFVHFSTAFCSVDIEVFEEKVYNSPHDPSNIMNVVTWLHPEALEKATPYILDQHANTYTYTKRLAEQLVAKESPNMPVCIIRPSIVTPALKEPVPGWVDNLNGPMGLIVGGGKGIIRSMHCKGELNAHIVPVDVAINATIVAAQKLGSSTQRPKEVPVYNLTHHGSNPTTWSELVETGREIIYEYPFDGQIWYPDGNIRSSKFVHNIMCILFHWIPALLIDGMMFVLCQKLFMIRIQRKVHNGLELLQFFTTRDWQFKHEKYFGLKNYLNDYEKKLFYLDFDGETKKDYLTVCILGARQYCMKEPLSSLPRSRVQAKM
ncbi:unnamed protein product [Brassicogethes aeneus]|uniref:Fatty acyl-CoA reductase n=1 Tax=Brassicogethes aeneus TaxID=1431903 RepID=A0A9P0FAR3_BRAAE|nr:unnamed protein product [Brassicogethes aeneus]